MLTASEKKPTSVPFLNTVFFTLIAHITFANAIGKMNVIFRQDYITSNDTVREWKYNSKDFINGHDTTLDDSDWEIASEMEDRGRSAFILKDSLCWFRKLIIIPESIWTVNVEGKGVNLVINIGEGGDSYVDGVYIKSFKVAGRSQDEDQRINLTANAYAGQKFLVAIKVRSDRNDIWLSDARLELEGKIKSVKVDAYSVIIKTPQKERQIINIEIVSGGLSNVMCQILKTEWAKPQEILLGDLSPGRQNCKIELPVIIKTGFAQIFLRSSTDQIKLDDVVLPKIREWDVYLVQNVHTDIGYTRPQSEILAEHLRYIDYALDYCDLTDDYPEEAKFRWTCEVNWAVREYLKRRPPEQVERLKKRVAEGRIEVTGMFLNMSEIVTEDAIAASLQPIRLLRENGLSVRTAMQNDVNGIAWGLVDYFSDINITYLTMGINEFRSRRPFDKPTLFWWESPSGKRMLAFRADHYLTGNFWGIHEDNLELCELRISEYLKSLEDRNYPYNRIAVQYSGYRIDNSPPSTYVCDFVRAWNEKYVWPRFHNATAHEFLEYIEKTHSDQLPVYCLAWPDWWSDGFGSAARETAESRRTHSNVQVNQGLLSMAALLGAKIQPETMARVTAIEDALLFYDEHTFGTRESIRDPMAENTMVQWGEKSSYIWEAVKNAGLLREEALGILQTFIPRAEVPTIAVFNTLNWYRSGLVEVFIDHEILPLDVNFRIIDKETGKMMSAQVIQSRREGTYWALWVENVPPMGYKIYRIEVGDEENISQSKNESKSEEMENSFYKIILDKQTGAIVSLIDKEMNRELVEKNCSWKFGQFIYEKSLTERTLKSDSFERTSLKNVTIEKVIECPIWKSIHIVADADGCDKPKGFKCEIRLYEFEKRIELNFDIRKLRTTSPEAVYVSFPFLWPNAKIIYQAQGGLVTPGVNQLLGSSSDWHTVQSFIIIRGMDGQAILGSEEIPLVQFNDINVGKWQYNVKVDKPHVYSWVMNNYWDRNFRASQEGEFKWSYYITSSRDTTITKASHFGMGSCLPLVPRVLPPGRIKKGINSLSTLTLTSPNIILVNIRPSYYDNSIILQLREIEGKSASVSVISEYLNKNFKSIDVVDVLEERLIGGVSAILFEPFEAKFVKLVF